MLASDVWNAGDLKVSTDGTRVYYFAQTGDSTKRLMEHCVTTHTNKIIDFGVSFYSVNSGLLSREIDPKSIWYKKYTEGAESKSTCEVWYYDGSTSRKIVTVED